MQTFVSIIFIKQKQIINIQCFDYDTVEQVFFCNSEYTQRTGLERRVQRVNYNFYKWVKQTFLFWSQDTIISIDHYCNLLLHELNHYCTLTYHNQRKKWGGVTLISLHLPQPLHSLVIYATLQSLWCVTYLYVTMAQANSTTLTSFKDWCFVSTIISKCVFFLKSVNLFES